MKNEKEYICVKKCPELDDDNLPHCVTANPDMAFKRVGGLCFTGEVPEWEIINDN